jgi:hypothetical protein
LLLQAYGLYQLVNHGGWKQAFALDIFFGETFKKFSQIKLPLRQKSTEKSPKSHRYNGFRVKQDALRAAVGFADSAVGEYRYFIGFGYGLLKRRFRLHRYRGLRTFLLTVFFSTESRTSRSPA